MSNKLLDNLSLDDLLNALENSPDKEKLPDDVPPILEFINRFKLESGKNRVESRLLWGLYLQYYPETITREIFVEHANKLLKYSRASFYLNVTTSYVYSLLVKKEPTKRIYRTVTKRTSKPMVHILSFFQDFNITTDNHKIPWFALFHLYRCYAVDKCIKKPASKQAFLQYTKLFFKSVPASYGSVFLVDKETANKIPKEDYPKLQKLYEKENYTKR